MLEAIDAATGHIFLSTYIFETNRTGLDFVEALGRAVARGVDTRVIIDGVGERYSWPRVSRLLANRGVRVARFLPPRLIPPMLHINLRNHRKVLIADGQVAFTGGMNIGDRHLAERLDNANRFIDLLLEDDLTARVILSIRDTLDEADGPAAPDITEADLALQLGVEKNDIRSALRRLVRVGVLEVSSGFVLVKDAARLEEFLEFIRNSGKS